MIYRKSKIEKEPTPRPGPPVYPKMGYKPWKWDAEHWNSIFECLGLLALIALILVPLGVSLKEVLWG